MLIYEKHTKLYSAEIREINHPLAKYQASYITRKGITPRMVLQFGWQSLDYAHKMINDRIKNTLKYNQETT